MLRHGGKVSPSKKREYGHADLEVLAFERATWRSQGRKTAAILDRWGGVDSAITYVDDAPRGPRR